MKKNTPAQEIAVLAWKGALPSRPELAALGAGRLYIGHEFCERLLPSREELRAAQELAGPALSITLNIPPLSEKAAAGIGSCLRDLEETAGPGAEVVFNDWGVLEALAGFPGLKRVLGRAIAAQHAYCGGFPEGLLDILCGAGVAAVELAGRPQLESSRSQLAARGLKAHLHYPFEYLTTTRYCGSVRTAHDDFRLDMRPCSLECLEKWGKVSYHCQVPGVSPLTRGQELEGKIKGDILVRGNAWFSGEDPAAGFPGPGPDRVVLNHLYFREAGLYPFPAEGGL
ncbi:MAG: hypothetical protein NDI60_10810 [Elusimicrobiales bacterium]|nr:hypothetical protein [Elusimicrobiales bacterium]